MTSRQPPPTHETGPVRIVDRARRLRRDQTPAERLLRAALRSRRCDGLKFRRQVPMGPFVLDSFDASHKLVLEIDGPYHDHVAESDLTRERDLERRGLTVLRFTNEDVTSDVEAVTRRIVGFVRRLDADRGVNP